MIDRPVVFVLGAGASQPYGFPTGRELRDTICKHLAGANTTERRMLQDLGHHAGEIEDFAARLLDSKCPSVDEFLETPVGALFLGLGKAAIAQELIRCETKEAFRNANARSRDWYGYVFDPAMQRFDGLAKSHFAVVTFNYDRSLEHYLMTAIFHRYGPQELTQVRPLETQIRPLDTQVPPLEGMPIVHVHGRLAPLRWQDPYGFDYSPELTPERIKAGRDNILIVTEFDDNTAPQLLRARKLLHAARTILFIGFGYHSANIERLGMADLPSGPARRIEGTAYNMTDAEVAHVTPWMGRLHMTTDAMGFVRNVIGRYQP